MFYWVSYPWHAWLAQRVARWLEAYAAKRARLTPAAR